MRPRAPCGGVLVAGIAALLALLSAIVALYWPKIFDAIVAGKIELTPTSKSYAQWVSPSIPVYFDIYLFNWTNAEDFPEAPFLEQLGPYRFLEKREKVNITWNPQNFSVSYKTQRSWFFDEEFSNGSLDDSVTTLNVIAASAVYRARDWNSFRQNLLSMGLTAFQQAISVTKTAAELLFDGYDDPLLNVAKNMPTSTTGGAPPVDRFGWFYERNNSMESDGQMEVTTGAESGSLPGQVLRWNNEEFLPFFSEGCSMLNGSVGEFMPRQLTPEDRLAFFSPDLCRTLNLDYEGVKTLYGLDLMIFNAGPRTLDNGSMFPENACFCDLECPWSGTMNVSACRHSSPAFVSLPHFLHADPELRTLVKGLEPDPEKHSFYFAVEPTTGIPLDVAARFQLNILIEPVPSITLVYKITISY